MARVDDDDNHRSIIISTWGNTLNFKSQVFRKAIQMWSSEHMSKPLQHAVQKYQVPILLTWIYFNPIISMSLHATAALLKFVNGYVIS